jgi:hypothetical protein
MKNVVKLLFAMILLIAMGTGAFAQVSGNTNVSATVIPQLMVRAETPVAFGNIYAGSNPTIDPVTGVTQGAGVTATVGKFVVAGVASLSTKVTFNQFTLLEKISGSGSLGTLFFDAYVSRLAGGTTNAGATFGGTTFASGTVYTIDATDASDIFFIGGRLSVANNPIPATAGNNVYSGTFVLTAQYN